MIWCENCGILSKLGEKTYKRVVSKRDRVYKSEVKGEIKQVGQGWEIETEINVCQDCAFDKSSDISQQ